MKFDPLPEIIAEESLFESGLLLAGAVAPAVVRRHVPEHTVWRPVHYLVRMSRSTHVLLTSRFETLSLAVGVAMTRSIDLSTDGKMVKSSVGARIWPPAAAATPGCPARNAADAGVRTLLKNNEFPLT